MYFIDDKTEYNLRYDPAKFIEFIDEAYDILNSYLFREINNLPVNGFVEVQGEEGRPDLLSYNIYKSTEYWFILLLYNNKVDVSDIKTGDKIYYPSIDSLNDLYFNLKSREVTGG